MSIFIIAQSVKHYFSESGVGEMGEPEAQGPKQSCMICISWQNCCDCWFGMTGSVCVARNLGTPPQD